MTQPPGAPQWWQPQGPQGPPSGPIPQQSPHSASPQPTPTFGGSFSTSGYGGFGAFDDNSPAKGAKSRTLWLVGAAAVVVLAGGGAAVWFSGVFSDDVLDQASLHEGITNVLRESYGEHDVSNVRCPEDQPITTGHTFDCKVDVAGQQRTVSIRILNDKPQYEVGAPH
ncbi:DUF4333 domain-containing protein [Saccharomonospora glauca]|jgi:hypothetical protein|uniref:DUF4333 domain-containing protein n=1 Tax=Saccharomonospora glauca K62 TaxID=928724 RepID=I1CXM9_9PSEU|nr:DUF4333 domain-containing protein [Saccharomonospora glauca]EIE97453.1 hypothetical protein SacglDRAFT_00502 [Saccharomonospora glauca K62]